MTLHTFFLLIVLPSFVGAACNDPSNVCQLDPLVYTSANGYNCFQLSQEQFMCTCYGNRFTVNAPCRCTTTQVCGVGNNVIGCRDKNNSEYSCLCKTEKSVEIVENNPCGSVTVNTTVAPTTSTSTHQPVIAHSCLNSGVYDASMQFCHCPSGFSGRSCERFDHERVCDRIVCKNGGTCTVGQSNGAYYSVCVCPIGFQGEYCEKDYIRGNCRDSPLGEACGGYLCDERVESDGLVYYRCAHCPEFSWGALCNPYTDLPGCQNKDRFIDPYMHEQGKYFECGESHRGHRPISREACPKGLRYSMAKNLCVLPEYA